MKSKIFLFALGIFTMAVANAQNKVGINTKTPAASLDVVAQPSATTLADGVIAPRVTRAQLVTKSANYGTSQTGAIVYVTDVSGTANTATTDITSIGYYHFNGTKWVAFVNKLQFASFVRNVDNAVQNPNSITSGNTYAGAGANATTCIVDLSSATQTLQGFTVSGKNVVIPSDGIYEIDFIATIVDNGLGTTQFRMYIGNTANSLMENWVFVPDLSGLTTPIKYVGSLTAGTNIDFRISTNGGSGQLRQFTIMFKKL